MIKIHKVLLAVMALLGTPAAAEVIELRCVTNKIDSEGNIEALPDLGGTPKFLVFNTSDRSVQYASWHSVSATHWDEEIIAWTAFSEKNMVAAVFMFNRSSGVLLVEAVSSWDLQNVDDGLPVYVGDTMFDSCTRTF